MSDWEIDVIRRLDPCPEELAAPPIELVERRLRDHPAEVAPSSVARRPKAGTVRMLIATAPATAVAVAVAAIFLLGHAHRAGQGAGDNGHVGAALPCRPQIRDRAPGVGARGIQRAPSSDALRRRSVGPDRGDPLGSTRFPPSGRPQQQQDLVGRPRSQPIRPEPHDPSAADARHIASRRIDHSHRHRRSRTVDHQRPLSGMLATTHAALARIDRSDRSPIQASRLRPVTWPPSRVAPARLSSACLG